MSILDNLLIYGVGMRTPTLTLDTFRLDLIDETGSVITRKTNCQARNSNVNEWEPWRSRLHNSRMTGGWMD